MPISSLTAARIVCERSDWQISNLKLHKILYLAQMAYMGRNKGKPLIDGHFQAWDYGPVLPDVYEIVARFGRDAIKDAFGPVGETDEKEKKALEFLSDTLLQFSAAGLVGITHWEHGAWAKNYAPGEKNLVISLEDIFDEYRDRKKYIKKEESAVIRKRITKYACKTTIFILAGPISFFLLCKLLAFKKSS